MSRLSYNLDINKNVLKLINKLKIENNVVVKSDVFMVEDMPKAYALADIVVLPSYSEGLGIVLLEAMSMKKPVVATNIAGINEVVKHNKTGLLVPIKSSKKLASSIKLLHNDKKLKGLLIQNAYTMMKNEFELNKQVKKVEQFFIKIYEKN